jgi:hypothetical protein
VLLHLVKLLLLLQDGAHSAVHVGVELLYETLLRLILFNRVLDICVRTVDDLLVQFELSFFLVKFLLIPADFHRVEVIQFVFVLQEHILSVQLLSLLRYFVLLVSC